jgi:hypothetical protein
MRDAGSVHHVLGRCHLLGLFRGLLDRADVHEGLFGEMVPLAVADFFEAPNGIAKGRDLAGLARKDFGHQKRLGEKAFQSASAVDDQFVLLAQFINPEDGDDVLELTVPEASRPRGAWS